MDLRKGSLLNTDFLKVPPALGSVTAGCASVSLSLALFLPAVRGETSYLLMIFNLQNDHLITWTSRMLKRQSNAYALKIIAAGTPGSMSFFWLTRSPSLPLIQSLLITSLLLLRDSGHTTSSSTERGHLKGGQHLLTGLICLPLL